MQQHQAYLTSHLPMAIWGQCSEPDTKAFTAACLLRSWLEQPTGVSFALQNGLLKHALSGLRTRAVVEPVHLSYPQRIRIAHDLIQVVLRLPTEAPVSWIDTASCHLRSPANVMLLCSTRT